MECGGILPELNKWMARCDTNVVNNFNWQPLNLTKKLYEMQASCMCLKYVMEAWLCVICMYSIINACCVNYLVCKDCNRKGKK